MTETSSKPNCGSCRFFEPNQGNISNGYCRRFPPHPFIAPVMTMTGPEVSIQSEFTPVARQSWCGEYATKVSLVN